MAGDEVRSGGEQGGSGKQPKKFSMVIKKSGIEVPMEEESRLSRQMCPNLKIIMKDGQESEIEAIQPILRDRNNKVKKRFRLPEP